MLIQLFRLAGYDMDLMDCIQTPMLLQTAKTLCNQIVEECQQQQHQVFHVG